MKKEENAAEEAAGADGEVSPPAEVTPLHREYTFWVFIKSSNRAADDWKPKPIASLKTVQEFWSVYQHLKRPSQLEFGTMINLVGIMKNFD